MKYTIYTIAEGTTITAEDAEAPEHNGYLVVSATWDGTLNDMPLVEQSRHASQYARSIRSAVRGLWSGVFDINQAFDAFAIAVSSGLTKAWNAGAAECGIMPADMTPEEKTTLAQIIANEQRFIFPFLLDVEDGSKANGGLWRAFASRLETWGLRYDDVFTRAKLMTCADQKTRWTINYTRTVKENCTSCMKLDRKVKRNSFWFREQVRPQNPPNPKLKCGGWKCGCGLPQTDEPLSRGPLPRLP